MIMLKQQKLFVRPEAIGNAQHLSQYILYPGYRVGLAHALSVGRSASFFGEEEGL